MLKAEYSSAFSLEPEALYRAGPFDLSILRDSLRRSFVATIEEPLPAQWRSLLDRLDPPRSRAARDRERP
jgi:hypothetical protein